VSLSFIKSTVLLTLRYQSWHFPSARGTGTLYVLTHTLSPHRDLLSSEADSKTASYILNTIREEEQQTELLKKASSGKMVNLGAADAVDTKDVAAEQSYNREQVQEQEQVRFACACGTCCSCVMVWWIELCVWGQLLPVINLSFGPALTLATVRSTFVLMLFRAPYT
jgi:hypothetical protein